MENRIFLIDRLQQDCFFYYFSIVGPRSEEASEREDVKFSLLLPPPIQMDMNKKLCNSRRRICLNLEVLQGASESVQVPDDELPVEA